MTLRAQTFDTPLGDMLGVASDAGIALLEFQEHRALPRELDDLRKRFDADIEDGEHPRLDALRGQLSEYFAGERRAFDLDLDAHGSPFERRVWDELMKIPFGETRSYAQIAEAVGSVARAVGRANGRNAVAIVVPCHRVIRADGDLCGYGGKIWRKERLLELEGARLPFASAG